MRKDGNLSSGEEAPKIMVYDLNNYLKYKQKWFSKIKVLGLRTIVQCIPCNAPVICLW